MKLQFFAAALLVALLNAGAAENGKKLDGTWRWDFTMRDGSETTPRVKFKTDKEGKITGTSVSRKGSEAPLTNIVVKGDRVSFDVVRDYLGDKVVTRYAGRISGDTIRGTITSKSNGEEQTYDWEATRPSGLNGAWKWNVNFGRRAVELTMTLKQDGEKLTGKIRGGGGGNTESEIHRGKVKDGNVSFETERTNREGIKRVTRYHGKVADDTITGKVEANFGGEWTTNKWEPIRAD